MILVELGGTRSQQINCLYFVRKDLKAWHTKAKLAEDRKYHFAGDEAETPNESLIYLEFLKYEFSVITIRVTSESG